MAKKQNRASDGMNYMEIMISVSTFKKHLKMFLGLHFYNVPMFNVHICGEACVEGIFFELLCFDSYFILFYFASFVLIVLPCGTLCNICFGF